MASKKSRLALDDQLCFALYAATNAVVRAYRPLLGEFGLTYPQYLVMLALWQDGTAPVHALAERLHLGSNAVTPLVDKLEAAGFVTRARGTDRRVVFVALTEAGIGLEGKVSAAQQSVVLPDRSGRPRPRRPAPGTEGSHGSRRHGRGTAGRARLMTRPAAPLHHGSGPAWAMWDQQAGRQHSSGRAGRLWNQGVSVGHIGSSTFETRMSDLDRRLMDG